MTTATVATTSTKFGSVSIPRKVSAGVVIVIGVAFLVITMMNNLFQVGPAFEEMIGDFRPVLTDESLAVARDDIAGLEAAGVEFQTVVVPAMAQALGVSAEEFAGLVESQYPAVAGGMAALPEITATFNGLIDTLDSQQELFASADAIPTESLPATTVPWIVAVSGASVVPLDQRHRLTGLAASPMRKYGFSMPVGMVIGNCTAMASSARSPSAMLSALASPGMLLVRSSHSR